MNRTSSLIISFWYLDNQWQNSMGILRSECKNHPPHYATLWTHNIAWRNFCSFLLTIVKSVKGVETQNGPSSSFFHNFCHWFSEKLPKTLKKIFYSRSFWITLKACNYPLCHYDISLNNFSILNNQLKYLGKLGKIFIFQIFFR